MTTETDNGQNDTSTDGDSQSEETLLTSTTATTTPEGSGQVKAEDKAGEEAAGDEGEANVADSQVPEGDYKFEMPEGMEIDQNLATRANTVFKDLGLTQAQANSLTKMVTEQRIEDAQAGQEAFTKQLDGWVEEIKADPSLGGPNFEKNAGIASAAVEKFGTPELKEMFNQTGAGNHPELFRFCLAIGKHLVEDQPGTGDAATADGDPADRMYAGTTPKVNG